MRRLILLSLLILVSCSTEVKRPTLSDLDTVHGGSETQASAPMPKTDDEIRRAYTNYIKHSSKQDNVRMAALNRLAEMELELSDKLQQERKNKEGQFNESLDDQLYTERLNTTINLLTTSLRDYPESKDADKVLYQLSKAYDQSGQYQQSTDTLKVLANKYPKSQHYTEAQFRLGEQYFSRADYVSAEDAYTEVITSKKSDRFYEKALFKRGWSRFKQQLYLESVDDFLAVVSHHDFPDTQTLKKTDQEQFDEYFRAIGLAFSYLGGADPLHEYFINDPGFKYIYHSYNTVSKIYLSQQRFSDAATTNEQFIKFYPDSENVPYAYLNIIEIWKIGGFNNKINDAIDKFYRDYNPKSAYWKNHNPEVNKNITEALKEYVLLITKHHHNNYQTQRKNADFEQASQWYQRYLQHYSAHARKDGIYLLYADLLTQHGNNKEALQYYELAAFDKDIILNKDAAYATIVLTDSLYKTSQDADKAGYLDKHISYALLYSELYPTDKHAEQTLMHAAELAFSAKQYDRAISLVRLIPDTASTATSYNAGVILGQSHFDMGDYAAAESAYSAVLNIPNLDATKTRKAEDSLALSIYRQAENAQDKQLAVQHFARISERVPNSEIAATGLYDAIALSMAASNWNGSIALIKRFQAAYPGHQRSQDVTKKLSVAYLSSNQNIKAAEEFVKISGFEGNQEIKAAALWQAAELYEKNNNLPKAIQSYTEYSNNHKKPYGQYMESLVKLVALSEQTGQTKSADSWRQAIVSADKKAFSNDKTDRTKYIASSASLELAREKHDEFSRYKLVLPLKKSLGYKKDAMQAAVRYYGQASVYSIAEITTEATHSIAAIYKDFSKELLNSERPKNLNQDELEQYVILLEDQAYPFEEKAIEFYEINLSRIKDGSYNAWIKKSHDALIKLFPVRYDRQPKPDQYVNIIQ